MNYATVIHDRNWNFIEQFKDFVSAQLYAENLKKW